MFILPLCSPLQLNQVFCLLFWRWEKWSILWPLTFLLHVMSDVRAEISLVELSFGSLFWPVRRSWHITKLCFSDCLVEEQTYLQNNLIRQLSRDSYRPQFLIRAPTKMSPFMEIREASTSASTRGPIFVAFRYVIEHILFKWYYHQCSHTSICTLHWHQC